MHVRGLKNNFKGCDVAGCAPSSLKLYKGNLRFDVGMLADRRAEKAQFQRNSSLSTEEKLGIRPLRLKLAKGDFVLAERVVKLRFREQAVIFSSCTVCIVFFFYRSYDLRLYCTAVWNGQDILCSWVTANQLCFSLPSNVCYILVFCSLSNVGLKVKLSKMLRFSPLLHKFQYSNLFMLKLLPVRRYSCTKGSVVPEMTHGIWNGSYSCNRSIDRKKLF